MHQNSELSVYGCCEGAGFDSDMEAVFQSTGCRIAAVKLSEHACCEEGYG